MKNEKPKHGGIRPGAGRPKQLKSSVSITFEAETRHVEKIKQIQHDRQLNSLGEALRLIIDEANS